MSAVATQRSGAGAVSPSPARTGLALALLLAALALLPGAATAEDAPGAGGEARWEHALAAVEGVAILRTEVAAQAALGLPRSQALQRLVTLRVLHVNLLRVGHDPARVGPDVLAEALEETRAAVRASGGDLEALLARSGRSLAQLEEELRVPLAFRAYTRSRIDEEALKASFPERAVALAGEVRASHIYVRAEGDPAAARARAAELQASLGASPDLAAFAALARESSDDPLAALTGGDLDWFGSQGGPRLPREVVAAAFARGAVGLLGEPVPAVDGVHLVYVVAVRVPSGATYERLRPRLLQQAELEEAAQVMDDWLERTAVDYAPDARPGASTAPPDLPGGAR